ncbi:MAG: hypothetical protein FWE67_15865 [Planctomycetaceae bacterium]|nr:hypothetical protein [Planctomycetaceae bacterium]
MTPPHEHKETFKAEIIRDTTGKQVRKFDVGVHNIAVKVIDNEGLENIETVELHINGGVKRKKQ